MRRGFSFPQKASGLVTAVWLEFPLSNKTQWPEVALYSRALNVTLSKYNNAVATMRQFVVDTHRRPLTPGPTFLTSCAPRSTVNPCKVIDMLQTFHSRISSCQSMAENSKMQIPFGLRPLHEVSWVEEIIGSTLPKAEVLPTLQTLVPPRPSEWRATTRCGDFSANPTLLSPGGVLISRCALSPAKTVVDIQVDSTFCDRIAQRPMAFAKTLVWPSYFPSRSQSLQ
ncbi:uncharacterized protein CLUP02_03929 [Colletotrichum lupini]|uniref:Uncharacterized protein n=1 Tax=Colletotrichum lupini TaxID=145971 RepID=A0A9Q8SL55_9PEZI|nr:uncharacterized protein CLUP02_03929 [Colletotrichum lupini]UQC78452.1 hypothetical protein CLUP02_03929 [Colletotrichum lupini]